MIQNKSKKTGIADDSETSYVDNFNPPAASDVRQQIDLQPIQQVQPSIAPAAAVVSDVDQINEVINISDERRPLQLSPGQTSDDDFPGDVINDDEDGPTVCIIIEHLWKYY